jgi:hypothetical protein
MKVTDKMIFRRRDVAEALSVSQAQVVKFETQGLLHAVKLQKGPLELRCTIYDPAEVAALAKRLLASGEPQEAA